MTKKTKTKILLITLLIAGILISDLVFKYVLIDGNNQTPVNLGAVNSDILGANFEDSNWQMVNKFQGWQTSVDAAKIPDGASPNGQNVIINDGDRVSIRPMGYEILGTATTTDSPVTSLHTFRRRSGENILMRSHGTYLEYYEEGNSTWESLRTTSTDGLIYGYADYNINTDLVSYVYFGNGSNNFARWTGAHTVLDANLTIGQTTISVEDASEFSATGSVRLCDTNITYSGRTDTSFTISASAINCSSTRGITQAIQEFPANPKGNIYLNASNRIFIAGVDATPQAVYFSKYGDATTYLTTLVSDSTADAAGIFNLGEGGGAVTGMVMDEGAIYTFKKSIVYKITLSDSLYNLEPLKPFDGRSQTTGSLTSRSVFVGNNGVFYITPDKKIMSLQRIESYDYPQLVAISASIQPTVNEINFDAVSGISWRDYAFFTVKSGSDVDVNDSVLVYNEKVGVWETPIVGWSASEFTVYDDGTGEALYFGDSATANVYKVIDYASDNNLDVAANWRTKRFDFGAPQLLKEITNIYVEGYISDNTTIKISLLLDEDGYTQIFTTDFSGIEEDFLYEATPYNVIGLHPFGFMRFGTSDEFGNKKFRIYLNKDFRAAPFYNAQLEFASDGENQNWEIISYGMKARVYSQPEKRTLYRSFK